MSKPTGTGAIIVSLVWDVGLSLGAYFAAKWLGADDYVALIAGSGAALLRVLYVAVRMRKFDLFAGVMLVVFGLGFLTSFLTGDARFLLLKESIGTGVAAAAFLVSCAFGRPLLYHAAARLQGDAAAADEKWRTVPAFRRNLRVMTLTWGAALLVDAVVRIPLIYLLPVEAAVTVSSVLFIASLVLPALWSGWFIKRAQAAAPVAAAV